MSRLATIELHNEGLIFSAGHLMVFPDLQRESMHGHDYRVHAIFNTMIKDNGMAFDYRIYKQKLLLLCQELDYRFILPSTSNYLRLEEHDNEWIVNIGTEKMSLLKRDTVVLPVCNVTLEELSNWFLQQLLKHPEELTEHHMEGITIKVLNGRGESGATTWARTI